MKKTIFTIALSAFAFAWQAQNLSEGDKKFAKMAAEDGMKEVKLSQMALEKSSSADVKKVAQMMVDEHTKANDELKTWASKNNYTLPASMGDMNMKDHDGLMKKTGAEFDKEYIKCMVKDHKKAVGEFKKAAEKSDNADLKSWAAKTLPTLEHHLKMSQDLEDSWKKMDGKDMKMDKDKTSKK